mmetsp:Transcript_27092/g.50651  ORF Transcript_27092/g.50651 Transcript_27092/m.50651 type:complete len:232 (+) Transcript_27092:61-756(+)
MLVPDDEIDETMHPRWNVMWNEGIEVGAKFDMQSPSPALVKLEREGLLPKGRALVPGCGRGYDVTFLASTDRSVLGLDIADKAVDTARARAQALVDDDSVEFTAQQLSQVEFSAVSFFDLPSDQDRDKFNLIYDYTFLCAMAPSLRQRWAEQMSALLLPGGELVTLIFPICDKPDGPPYAMSQDLVRELLEGVGLEAVFLEALPSELCHPGRDGTGIWDASSALGRWRKVG